MLKRFRVKAAHTKLLASLAFNFLAKLPGIAAVFIILPLVSKALGTTFYGELLSALALSRFMRFPAGGINTVGRRLLATTVGAQDKERQANVFRTTTTFMALAAVIAAAVMLVMMRGHGMSHPVFLWIGLLPIVFRIP